MTSRPELLVQRLVMLVADRLYVPGWQAVKLEFVAPGINIELLYHWYAKGPEPSIIVEFRMGQTPVQFSSVLGVEIATRGQSAAMALGTIKEIIIKTIDMKLANFIEDNHFLWLL